ncbi:cytochrome P450 4F3 [Engraulis encrasicolus]|uniref:cytochrome P450 4F3 n=1 Tax=Engraulis encrasicolus TaxID=184585 RepID=UPI002FD0A3B0
MGVVTGVLLRLATLLPSGFSIWTVLCVIGLALVLFISTQVVLVSTRRSRLSCFALPPTRNWLLGHMGIMQSHEEGFRSVDELVRTYRHSCAWFLGPFYNLVRFFHPDYIKPLLLAPASVTIKDELFYGLMRPWLGQSLLLSNGEQWSRQRRLLTPAFHFDILKSYVLIFNQSAHIMHAKWRRLVDGGQDCLEMFEQLSLMTLDSLLKCVFSYDSHCQEESNEYISAIMKLSVLVVKRQRRLAHHWDSVYWRSPEGKEFRQACEVVHGFTASVVQQRRAELEQQGAAESHQVAKEKEKEEEDGVRRRVTDFIELLLQSKDEDGNGLTDEEIKAQADTFMFAGHDTTASAISWVLYNLARHPEYQQRCRDEVNALLEDRDQDDILWDDLTNMPFTTMCIKESLRLHPPVAALSRAYSVDKTVPGDRTVPKGSICLVSIYGTHHNPTVWPDPDVYNPMRFENLKGSSPYSFIPFSAGPRNCIGQKFAMVELRVAVALTLRRFRLTSEGPEARRLYSLVMRAEGGIHLHLEPLHPPHPPQSPPSPVPEEA